MVPMRILWRYGGNRAMLRSAFLVRSFYDYIEAEARNVADARGN